MDYMFMTIKEEDVLALVLLGIFWFIFLYFLF